jgi:protein-disulfide isomerase
VSGAERNARKRRQEIAAKRAVAAARKAKSDRNKIIITVAVVLVIAGAVLAGVLITNNQKNKTADVAIAPKTVAVTSDISVKRDGATVLVGKDAAKTTVDIYEDFLCPVCGRFEAANADALTQKVNDGSIKVRYHLVNLLNNSSDPAGYSTDAANAALCTADAGKFPAYHASLYGSQPAEGARGYDKTQLTKLGQDLGITSPDFASCVSGGTYNQAVSDEYQKAKTTPYLQQDVGGQRGFGTPTVAVGEKVIDTSDPNWLTTLTAAQAG